MTMSDAIDLMSMSPPVPLTRQKRRRVDDSESAATQSSTLAQISTWETPSDILSPSIDLFKPKADSDIDNSAHDTPTNAPPEPLSAHTCPICFSPPTNATLTPCGHVCCGQCLFTAVKSTMRRNMLVATDRAPVATCPVCRAEIPQWDGRGGGVIGLKMQVLYSL